MVIDIGHIDKRINSTKQTFTKLFQNKTVYLKQPTSVVTPVFILKDTENDNNHKYSEHTNYIYVPEWGYYWIDNIIYRTHDIVEFHCSRDTLATGKDYIKKVNAYVKYCSDLNIATDAKKLDDDRLGPDRFFQASLWDLGQDAIYPGSGKSLVKDWLTFTPGEGTIILSTIVLGAGLVHWALTIQQFVEVMMAMAGAADGSTGWDDFTAKFFGSDWKSCIVQARFIPIKKDKIDADPLFAYSGQIMAGAIQVTGQSNTAHGTVSPAVIHYNYITRQIPSIGIRLPFLNAPKYTSVTIEHFANSTEVSNQALVDCDVLAIEESIDVLNACYTQKIYATREVNGSYIPTTLINTFTDEFGVDLTFALSHTASFSDQIVGMGVSALKGIISTGIGAAVGSIGGGQSITNTTETFGKDELRKYSGISKENGSPTPESRTTLTKSSEGNNGASLGLLSSGILGAFTSCSSTPIINNLQSTNRLTTLKAKKEDGTYREDLIRLSTTLSLPSLLIDADGSVGFDNYDTFCELYGYPCNKYVTLGDVADDSFILCVGADAGEVQITDITFTLTKPELAVLNNWLNTGIYLE